MKRIGLIVSTILMIGGVAFYIGSSRQSEQERVLDTTEESKNFFDFRSSPNESAVSSSLSTSETTSDSSADDQIEGGEKAELESESIAFMNVNEKLLDAYYGEWSMDERNQQLRNILLEALHEEYLFTDDGEIFSGSVTEFSYQSFHNQQEDTRATVVNVLEMTVDSLEQRVLITVELEFDGKWLISDLKFELIYG